MRTAETATTAGGHTWTKSTTYGNAYFLSPAFTIVGDSAPSISGNITYVKDIYGGVLGAVGAATNLIPGSYVSAPSQGQGNGIFKCHIQIRPASGKVPNYIVLMFAPGNLTLNDGVALNDGAIMATSLCIQEYNAAFSYRTNNIGPEAPGSQSQDLIYLDTLGQRVVPYKQS